MDNMYAPIEKWSLNNRVMTISKHSITNEEDKSLFDSIMKRPSFAYTDQSVTIPTVYVSFMGVKGDIEDYNIFLYDLDNKLSKLGDLYKKIETPLNKKFPPDLLKKLQQAWSPFQTAQSIKAKDVVKSFFNNKSLKLPSDKNMKLLLSSSLEKTLSYYMGQKDFRQIELKNIIFHIIHWYNTYCKDLLNNFDYTQQNPTILFWKSLNKRELYFTLFLRNMGSDIVCVTSTENKEIEDFSKKEDFVNVFHFPRQIELDDYPIERPKKRINTVAKQCSDELQDTLHSDDSFCYKPWQFINYSVQPLTMRTTIDEVLILGTEKAMLRQGWEASANTVCVPHFFTKINGIYSNHKDYWKKYNKIRSSSKILICEQSTLVNNSLKLMKEEYYSVYDRNTKALSPERLKKASFWPYMQYRNHIQELIVEKCISLCTLENFKRIPGIPPEMQKIEIFSRMMQIPNTVLNLLQSFDYPFDVPKLLVYNSRDNYVMSQDDAIVIAFVASAAVDVIIFNTTGQKDIEIYLEEHDVDIHFLEDVAVNIKPKTHSIMGKFF